VAAGLTSVTPVYRRPAVSAAVHSSVCILLSTSNMLIRFTFVCCKSWRMQTLSQYLRIDLRAVANVRTSAAVFFLRCAVGNAEFCSAWFGRGFLPADRLQSVVHKVLRGRRGVSETAAVFSLLVQQLCHCSILPLSTRCCYQKVKWEVTKSDDRTVIGKR
jgi:hypothetical protein